MPDLPSLPETPIGDWLVRFIFDVFIPTLGPVLEAYQSASEVLVGWVETLLSFPPPLIFAAIAAVLGAWLRSWFFGAFSLIALLLIQSMGFWQETIQTLALILVATAIAIVIGVPIGILASRNTTVSTLARPVLDFMQTMPVFVYVVIGVALFSLGVPAGLAATVVFATPPGVRLTELGIRQVDPEIVEAAQAFGAGRNQILARVQVPLALPSIMQGVNQVIMLALSMVVVAGLVGTPGLGVPVVRGLSNLSYSIAIEGGISVVLLAIFLDRLTGVLKDRVAAGV